MLYRYLILSGCNAVQVVRLDDPHLIPLSGSFTNGHTEPITGIVSHKEFFYTASEDGLVAKNSINPPEKVALMYRSVLPVKIMCINKVLEVMAVTGDDLYLKIIDLN